MKILWHAKGFCRAGVLSSRTAGWQSSLKVTIEKEVIIFIIEIIHYTDSDYDSEEE